MPGHAQLRRRNLDLSRPRRARGNGDNADYALQNPSGGGGGGGGGGGAGDDEANVNPEAVGGSSWLQTFLKVMAVILVGPPLLNYATMMRERQLLKPENHTLYDIGFGQKMYMSCKGHGAPTVILDGPAGMTSDINLPLQEELSALARVCIFDRAGLGFSDPMPFFNRSDPVEKAMAGPDPHTSHRASQDLRRLITRALPQSKDLVLVGSQLGSLNMLQYAHSFPEGVSQLVLIDPPHPSLFEGEGWPTYVKEYWKPYNRMVQTMALFGLNRMGLLLGAVKSPPPCRKPRRKEEEDGVVINYKEDDGMREACLRSSHFMTDPNHIGAGATEVERMEAGIAQLNEALLEATDGFKVPTSVITGNYYDEMLPMNLNRAWAKAAQETVSLLSAQQVIVNDADHKMLYLRPDDFTHALRKIIKRVKKMGQHQKTASI